MPFFFELHLIQFLALFEQKNRMVCISSQNFRNGKNSGLSPTITQALGEIETSQSVKAYSASMVLSGENII